MYVLVPMRLVGRRDGVVEADQRVVDERRRVGDAVQEHGRPSGHCSEVEIDLLREDGDRACRLQPARVGDREADLIPGEAAEIMPRGRDREGAARHSGDGSARMHMPFVQEVDLPGVGARGQRAVLRVGRAATEGDDVTRLEQRPIGRGQNGCRRPTAGTDAQRRRDRRIHSVGYREPDLIGAGDGVRMCWVGRCRRGVIAEVPRIGQWLAFGIGGAGAGEVDHERRRARMSGLLRPARRAAGWNRRS